MCKLIITQPDYHRVEFEFNSPSEAVEMINKLILHMSKDTKFIIECLTKGEQSGETGI